MQDKAKGTHTCPRCGCTAEVYRSTEEMTAKGKCPVCGQPFWVDGLGSLIMPFDDQAWNEYLEMINYQSFLERNKARDSG